MQETTYFLNYFSQLHDRLLSANESEFGKISELVLQTYQHQRKIICVGNGGSAAIASHVESMRSP